MFENKSKIVTQKKFRSETTKDYIKYLSQGNKKEQGEGEDDESPHHGHETHDVIERSNIRMSNMMDNIIQEIIQRIKFKDIGAKSSRALKNQSPRQMKTVIEEETEVDEGTREPASPFKQSEATSPFKQLQLGV